MTQINLTNLPIETIGDTGITPSVATIQWIKTTNLPFEVFGDTYRASQTYSEIGSGGCKCGGEVFYSRFSEIGSGGCKCGSVANWFDFGWNY